MKTFRVIHYFYVFHEIVTELISIIDILIDLVSVTVS
jgi:hypothetical protein